MILFVFLAFIFGIQLKHANWSEIPFYPTHPIFLALTVSLMPLNWYFEWKKWELVIEFQKLKVEKHQKMKSFFAGIISGMLTPNMLGNFIGRIYYFNRKDRTSLTVLTLISNYAQFLTSLFFGVISLFLLEQNPLGWNGLLTWVSSLIFVLSVFLYLYFDWILIRICAPHKFLHRFALQWHGKHTFQFQIWFFSIMRHLIFSVQLASALIAFGEVISIRSFYWIWQNFFWLTFSPSLIFGKLIVRESIAAWVLGFAGMHVPIVILTSFFIWCINLMIPSLFGLIICKTKTD